MLASSHRVFDAIAAEAYLSASRLADELGLSLTRTRSALAALERDRLIVRDQDDLSWRLTEAGWAHRRSAGDRSRRALGRLAGVLRH